MMRIEDYPTQSVKMNAIEVELVQEHRKVLAVFGIMKICVREFQLHVECLGWT